MKRFLSAAAAMLVAAPLLAADPIRVLIVDGQNNHNWRGTTPILKKILEDAKIFTVEVATAPSKAAGPPKKPSDTKNDQVMKVYEEQLAEFKIEDAKYKKNMAAFRPKFKDFQVVVSNYNGEAWPKETQSDFAEFVATGGGFVCVHAADNSFPEWPEYNAMIGVGGWGGRNEKSGPYVRVRDGKVVRDETRGNGGSHGAQHAFVVVVQDAEHPITKGLPAKWMHATDELYDRLRGPAQNLTVLAYANADKAKNGSGENEPMLMAIAYEKGRVFHTTLGHSEVSMKCVGFQTTFARGTEWAATGKVTIAVPSDFPGADKVSSRP
ncbi:MAG TPA: ThuA domain-containing protein [Gemmataceae bacterium]|jgi:type 1 glutamine amidotransferase|nr:ThuA domain-containing protein [Gemmataceae bacterium]